MNIPCSSSKFSLSSQYVNVTLIFCFSTKYLLIFISFILTTCQIKKIVFSYMTYLWFHLSMSYGYICSSFSKHISEVIVADWYHGLHIITNDLWLVHWKVSAQKCGSVWLLQSFCISFKNYWVYSHQNWYYPYWIQYVLKCQINFVFSKKNIPWDTFFRNSVKYYSTSSSQI